MTKRQNPFDVHQQDQLEAAVEHATNLIYETDAAVSQITNQPNREKVIDNWPDSYVGQKFKWMSSEEEFRKVRLIGCPHYDMKNPRVGFINLWAPTAIGCPACIKEKAEGFYAQFPNVCDYCFEKFEIFHESMFQIGPFVIYGNLCQGCYKKQYAEE